VNFEDLPPLEWIPDPKDPEYFYWRNDRKLYYAKDLPEIAFDLLPLDSHELSRVVYLARPTDPGLRDKWVVCVFRLPVHVRELNHESYYAGLIDGWLISHLPRNP